MKYQKPSVVVLASAMSAISCTGAKAGVILDSVAGCPGPPHEKTTGAAYEADE